MDLPYYALEIEEQNAQTPSQPFQYLNKLIMYFPIWSAKFPSKRSELKWCNVFIAIVIVAMILYYNVYITYDQITNYDFDIETVVHILRECCFAISRLFSVYYFQFQFNCPWNSTSFGMIMNETNSTIKKYYIFICSLITSMSVLELGYVFFSFYNKNVLFFITKLIGAIFIYIPLYVTFGAASMIYIYYYAVLHELLEDMKTDTIQFNAMFVKYKERIASFDRDYHFSLKWCIYFRFMGIMLSALVEVFDFVEGRSESLSDYWMITVYIPCILLFVVSASLLSEEFMKYELLLFQYGEQYINVTNNNENDERYIYMYLSKFILKYPFTVSIGTRTVSKKGLAQFVALYGVVKLLSYSLSTLYIN
eukprot:327914_1